jgi:hypothetical protein
MRIGDPAINVKRCAMCGKLIPDKRSGAKTCSDTCRKRYSRRKDKVRECYDQAKSAIDFMSKYANHDDLRDLLSMYTTMLQEQLSKLAVAMDADHRG